MLDAAARQWIDPPLDRLAGWCARRGLGADAVTLAGFAVGVGACGLLALGLNFWALAAIAVNRACDGLDGALARRLGPTDRGGFLDIVCDFLFYSGVPFSMAVRSPGDALAACFLVFAFVGTGSSFLAYAAISAKRGAAPTPAPRGFKALRYAAGLTEGTETIALFVLFCLVPGWFAPLCWGFGALCWLTTATRVVAGCREFSGGRP